MIDPDRRSLVPRGISPHRQVYVAEKETVSRSWMMHSRESVRDQMKTALTAETKTILYARGAERVSHCSEWLMSVDRAQQSAREAWTA